MSTKLKRQKIDSGKQWWCHDKETEHNRQSKKKRYNKFFIDELGIKQLLLIVLAEPLLIWHIAVQKSKNKKKQKKKKKTEVFLTATSFGGL